jgi:hypothetical protein
MLVVSSRRLGLPAETIHGGSAALGEDFHLQLWIAT